MAGRYFGAGRGAAERWPQRQRVNVRVPMTETYLRAGDRRSAMESCEHLQQTRQPFAKARTEGCEECLATGGGWVELRVVLACGQVGCCDSSPGRHATAHFHETHHEVMQSFEPGQ